MSRLLHVVSAIDPANGMSVVAHLLAQKGAGRVVSASEFRRMPLEDVDEVWVHGLWLPCLWRACLRVIETHGRVRLVRMTHGALSPVPLRFRGRWRKALVAPVERWLFARCDRVMVTGEWEADWYRAFAKGTSALSVPIEALDLKGFFRLPDATLPSVPVHAPLRVLYLGRRHPLKGHDALEAAVRDPALRDCVSCRVVSSAFGNEKVACLEWCDVLVLPSSSENFGLVVAEALEANRRVIVTDAMPAWCDGETYGGRLACLRGWLAADPSVRKDLIVRALLDLG